MKHVPIEIGSVFGRLTVTSRVEDTVYYNCKCICGNVRTVPATDLRNGGTRSCGCLKRDSLIERHKKTNPNRDSRYVLLSRYKYYATKRGLSFELDDETFYNIVQQPCVFCGDKNVTVVENRYGNYPFYFTGVDRIDSDKGYTADNVQPCCKMCNRMKMDHQEGFFLHHIEKVYKHSKLGGIDA